MTQTRYDVVVIGAGIIGLATARALLQRLPDLRVVIVEKESAIGRHQTGHNSGVVHSGIYYKPGSLKAKLCVDGARRMAEYAVDRGVAYERIGKIITAVRAEELPALETLYERGQANGVQGLRRLTGDEIAEYEPHAAGLAAIWAPSTGIVDYKAIASEFARDLTAMGCEILTEAQVLGIVADDRECVVSTGKAEIHAGVLVNCAGLFSDRIALMTGVDPGVRIVPFRGEYYAIRPERASLVRGLIYPVPDPRFPFLGVHFTRSVFGSVEAGPNAVLALAREGYRKSDFVPRDFADTLKWSGFRRLAARYWRIAFSEMRRSVRKRAFAESLRQLVPEIEEQDLVGGGAGVRAQAVNARGEMVDDFHVVVKPRAVHVLNVPSPAATASLAIGDYLVPYIMDVLAAAGGRAIKPRQGASEPGAQG